MAGKSKSAVRLTGRVVEKAEARAARYTLWDSELPGFGLRVEPTGAKSFVLRYRAGKGAKALERFMVIGRPPAVEVKDAREAASTRLAQIQLGQDPAAEEAARRRRTTVAELVELYGRKGLVILRGARMGHPMKPLTARYTMARLRHHVVPVLGRFAVADLTAGHIKDLADAVIAGETAKDEKGGPRTRVIVKGGEGAARKVVRDFSAVLSFAQREEIVEKNPVATAAVRKTDNRRERFLSLEEVQRLGRALDELAEKQPDRLDRRGRPLEPINKKALDITRLWALTGCRRNEIAGLKWENVKFELGLFVFDDTKTGRSVRPLAGAAAALLRVWRDVMDEDEVYVFPAERGSGHYQGTKQVWPEVAKRAGLPGITPHTLRHTLGAAAASGGEGLLLVGAILGHANARSTAIYAHVDRDPARLAAERATAGIAAALGRPGVGANHAAPPAVDDRA